MVALTVLVVTVAVLDSLNPSTVGPALVLAAVAPHSVRRVAAFTVGVFMVSTTGGVVLLAGPGHALLARVAKPSPHAEHLAAVVCGSVLLAVAAVLWSRRNRTRTREARTGPRPGRSAFLLGGGIMAVELPTAVPYFAVLVAIAAARRDIVEGLLLVLLYNALFVLPLLVVLVLIVVAGSAADERLLEVRLSIERRAPAAVPLGVGAIGLLLLVFGVGAF